jgi:hypothetical protein
MKGRIWMRWTEYSVLKEDECGWSNPSFLILCAYCTNYATCFRHRPNRYALWFLVLAFQHEAILALASA